MYLLILALSSQQSALSIQQSAKTIYRKGRKDRKGVGYLVFSTWYLALPGLDIPGWQQSGELGAKY